MGIQKAMRMIPLLLGTVLGLAPQPARGGDAAAADPGLRLATELVARGDAAGAAVEFRRLALAAPDPVARGGFEWAAAREHARDGRIDSSERMLDRAEDSGAPKAPCLLLRAENAQAEGDFNSASFFWSAFREATDEPDARTYAARKFAAAMIRDQRPDDAIQALGFSPRDESAAITAVEAWRGAPRKSPRLGGLLGLVPGLGYAYSGEYANAVRSLILNGLFLSLMAISAEDDSWGAFGLAAFFEITWYSGSIYGGVDAAHRWNLRNTMTAVRHLEGDAVWEADDKALPVIDLRFSF